MNYKLIALSVFTLISVEVNSQKISKNCVFEYSKSYLYDTKSYITTPLKWKKKELLLFSGVIATGTVLFWQDEWINKQFDPLNPIQENVAEFGFYNFGNGYYTLPLMGGMFLYGSLAKKEIPFKTSLSGVKAFVLSTIVTRAIKYSFNRNRPIDNNGPYFFAGPLNEWSLSFPSGHTTTAFALAAVLAKNYKHRPLIPVLSYLIATGVGAARVWGGEHWASDVFVGALVGWSVGTIVSNVDCSEKSSIHILPNGFSYVF